MPIRYRGCRTVEQGPAGELEGIDSLLDQVPAQEVDHFGHFSLRTGAPRTTVSGHEIAGYRPAGFPASTIAGGRRHPFSPGA